jgi:hypothetical protein
LPGAASQIARIESRLHIATLGTPRDVTLEEIRIEFFFPMDEPTAQAFRSRMK